MSLLLAVIVDDVVHFLAVLVVALCFAAAAAAAVFFFFFFFFFCCGVGGERDFSRPQLERWHCCCTFTALSVDQVNIKNSFACMRILFKKNTLSGIVGTVCVCI